MVQTMAVAEERGLTRPLQQPFSQKTGQRGGAGYGSQKKKRLYAD